MTHGGSTSSSRRGDDYLRGLKGRRIVVAGRLVDDLTQDPGLRPMADFLAGLLDRFSAAGDLADAEGFPVPYALASSAQDVAARGRVFADVARSSGGLLGRSPDFLATILASWRGAAAYFGDRADAVVAYWEQARSSNLVLTHAISDPPADRHLPAELGLPTQALRAVGESADGLVVRGVKMLATLAPYADDLVVYPFRPLGQQEADQALCLSVPVDTPGLTLYCRPGLASAPVEDHPLAARFDEMDAICVFEDVVVPWERVFLHGDVAKANGLRAGTGMTTYAWHQSAVRSWVKAEFVFGLARAAARAAGRDRNQATRQHLGELAGIAETLRSLVVAAEAQTRTDAHGNVVPDPVPLATAGMLNAQLYPRAIELLQLIVSSGLVMHPVSADEAPDSPAHAVFSTYFAGADIDSLSHGRLLRICAELTLDRFGGRQELYERVFLGPPDIFRATFYDRYTAERAEPELPAGLLA
ncbi:4-hydroxyphenylacetate 3-monooxygenase/anthranilate 3-monooxygenase (FAD)/4-hydroxyphenylacetate 3-monooxygenase [Krasilnikovia cinnamomea]|uniref:4-hydroxyphenylacetate 3-monooxygenase/anthranilate 3-monooxygenase (FAD)/4-hydroxyphenylacetate 3-monooxygenase n=1 Tax=Krasilnikovia cinnamomea TaxID=349313 RepID=A0A4Q7ZM14_9ACTN|nr:4-hydroxyphenylacetate 3-hydroxylase N-terminal domain-containing protein [Krasilnikovia cinnamomea]RZU51661.1 4-hydroxyphenylacetate 3-monooxygenase/anthranilate 3-monooxygenase (FAD)/4-hydroxyphenylacetate 3-monooxygenase [Krasilnikovia cinnamomea]